MTETKFLLHPKLEADTQLLFQLGVSDVLLINDSRFPWLILVPRVVNACEWFDLSDAEQLQLNQEVSQTATKLKKITHADKINIAALGNQVPQLHIHVIARFKHDSAWPNPVWGNGVAAPYTSDALDAMIKSLANLNITNL